MTDPTPLSIGLGFAAFAILTIAILAAITGLLSLLTNDPADDAPLMTPPADTGCNAHNPHVMLPTSYGWRCARDCGERWHVEDTDPLAVADLAMWELELGADA